MNSRILLLSYAFPPFSVVESYLSAKTVGGLSRFGKTVDVVHADPISYAFPEDRSLLPYVTQRFRKIESIKASCARGITFRRKVINRFLPVVHQLPDPFVHSNCAVVRAVNSWGAEQYSAMVSWSQYHSIHLAALKLKRKHPHLKWIARLSDPWIDNSYVNYRFPANWLNRRWEAEVMHAADRIVITNDRSRDLIMAKYPASVREKAVVLEHPFDPDLFPQRKEASRRKKLIRYLGTFYGPRTPDRTLRAIDELYQRDRTITEKFTIEFVGVHPHEAATFFSNPKWPADFINYRAPVDYLTSLSLMSDADLLLVIDAPAKESVFLPAKLVDYVGAGRPILGITPLKGVSADLIRELKGPVADPADQDQIKALFEKIAAGDLPPGPSENVAKRYSVDTVSSELNRLIEE